MNNVATLALCSRCGNFNLSGEMICSRCGVLLGPGLSTQHLENVEQAERVGAAPVGKVSSVNRQPITFQIGDKEIALPLEETISLGRLGPVPSGASRCDVDLTPYGAELKGVSRKHLLIRRRNALIYVSDLGSTNGTRLNGQQLFRNAERLLRSGDELQLGYLKAIVRF